MARLDFWVRDRRKALGLSQESCAEVMGVSLEEWQDLEDWGAGWMLVLGPSNPKVALLAEALWVAPEVVATLGEVYRLVEEFPGFGEAVARIPARKLTLALQHPPPDLRSLAQRVHNRSIARRRDSFERALEELGEGP